MSEFKTSPTVEIRASRLGFSVALVLSADTTFLAQSLLEKDSTEHLCLVYKKAVPRIAEKAVVEVLTLLEKFSEALDEETQDHARSYFSSAENILRMNSSVCASCSAAHDEANL